VKPENMNPNASMRQKKRAKTPKKIAKFDVVLRFQAKKMWEDLAPKCSRRVNAVHAFNHATANWHLLK